MTCMKTRQKLPGYLDGTLMAGDHARLREHLEHCADCRCELESYRKLAALLGQLEPVAPPPDLATRIRVQASQRRAERSWGLRLRTRAFLVFENILRPVAVPATGGLVTALLVFAFVVHSLLVTVPLGAVSADLPTNLLQPARLEMLAAFPVSEISGAEGTSGAGTLVLEATVNARGEAVDYHILSGPESAAVRRQLDQVLMFSRFRPQLSFGRPTSGGRVVLSFSQIRVKG
jgi:hypothetical protein